MYVVQHVTGGVVALARAGHCHAVGRVRAAVLGRVQLPAELTCDGEREVGLLLARLPLQKQNKAGHHYRDMVITKQCSRYTVSHSIINHMHLLW